MDFAKAVEFVLKHEGGYIQSIHDPGGETKFGISKRQYPTLSIQALTRDEAIRIYRRDYWDALQIDQYPPRFRLAVFDCAVNQGQSFAAASLQRALGIPADGQVGPKTLAALSSCNAPEVLQKFFHRRHLRYASNPGWLRYGEGWSWRLTEVALLSGNYEDHS